MNIKFDNFNQRRHMRGADAAQFLITHEDGEEEYLWMSKSDIQKNLKQFPEHAEELNKGLHCYNN
jgi:ribosomal 50S subunit-associated protein YjgA (DUF615 family)